MVSESGYSKVQWSPGNWGCQTFFLKKILVAILQIYYLYQSTKTSCACVPRAHYDLKISYSGICELSFLVKKLTSTYATFLTH
jgi:hypothetical protein